VITVAQHVTVALTGSGVSRVYGLPGDSLNRRANELPDPVTTDVARRIFE
jgi:thiamine pyrophosphate-dependent acetolactate synthase large subunit-like protein